jgi:hypothetical protein
MCEEELPCKISPHPCRRPGAHCRPLDPASLSLLPTEKTLAQMQKRPDSPARFRDAVEQNRILGQFSVKMELRSLIETRGAPGCVFRRSSIA